MVSQHIGISPYSVNLPRVVLKQMLAVVRSLQDLSENKKYIERLGCLDETVSVKTNQFSVLMGYDFHVTDSQQVKLIEVNTNAGGLWFANSCYQPNAQQFTEKLAKKLLQSFFDEYSLFCNKPAQKPKLVAIVDKQPLLQFLFPEMQVFAKLFQQTGVEVVIIDPSEITASAQALYFKDKKIDLIYNRHCDFYLKSTEMALIKKAWLEQNVCLTPNPKVYGLLADKQRMVDWSNSSFLIDLLPSQQADCLINAVPQTQMLNSFSKQSLWLERKQWVFKPINGYASRGVYVGAKLTKNKFDSLDDKTTLVQQRIKPSVTVSPTGSKFKTDFRLFVYKNKMMALSARLYQGQVTNLRTENGGFCKVNLT